MHGSDSLLQLLGWNGNQKLAGDDAAFDESAPLLPRARSSKRLSQSDSPPLSSDIDHGQSAYETQVASPNPGLGGAAAKVPHAQHLPEKPAGKVYPCDPSAYTLLHTAGTGVSSTVYAATCLPLDERVAIKCCNMDSCEDCSEMVEEVLTMRRYKHPCILPLYCTFVVKQELWMVMEYCKGGSVAHLMKFRYPEGLEEVVIATILKAVLRALEYIHKQGDMHRDVKSGNVLLKSNGSVLLGDFGVSCSMQRAASWGNRRASRSTMVGTPCWMAPEVMEQEQGYASSADIWSLGITMLELAHGHAPFHTSSPLKILLMTLQNPPPTLEDHVGTRTFSKSMREVVTMCLQKDPHRRPTATSLLEHRFFRQARDSEWLAKHLGLAELPPLHEREQRIRKGKAASFGADNDAHLAASMSQYYANVQDWDFSLSHTALDSLDSSSGSSTPARGSSPPISLPPSPVPSSSNQPNPTTNNRSMPSHQNLEQHLPTQHTLIQAPTPSASIDSQITSGCTVSRPPLSALHDSQISSSKFGRDESRYAASVTTGPREGCSETLVPRNSQPTITSPTPQSAARALQFSLNPLPTQGSGYLQPQDWAGIDPQFSKQQVPKPQQQPQHQPQQQQQQQHLQQLHPQQQQQQQLQWSSQKSERQQRGRFIVISEERVPNHPGTIQTPKSSAPTYARSHSTNSSAMLHAAQHMPPPIATSPLQCRARSRSGTFSDPGSPAHSYSSRTDGHIPTTASGGSDSADDNDEDDYESESDPCLNSVIKNGLREQFKSFQVKSSSQLSADLSFAFPPNYVEGSSPTWTGLANHAANKPSSSPSQPGGDTACKILSSAGHECMQIYNGWPVLAADELNTTLLPSELTISGWNGVTRRELSASLTNALAAKNSSGPHVSVPRDIDSSEEGYRAKDSMSLAPALAARDGGLTSGSLATRRPSSAPNLPIAASLPKLDRLPSTSSLTSAANVGPSASSVAGDVLGASCLKLVPRPVEAALPAATTNHVTKGRFKIVSSKGV